VTSERTDTAADAGSGGESDADAVALDRVGAKLERLASQRTALRRAMGQFGEDFDLLEWTRAFDSPDPDDINRVFTVTGGYLALVNNTAEAIRAGAKPTDLKPTPGMTGIAGLVDAIRADGGFTSAQAETFTELYRTRNRLQHSSPDMQADELHAQVRLLLGHLPRFVKSYLAWLQTHDVEL
jgi:hypothetical protein